MKILCDREKLRDGLGIVNNVIPTKSTKPVIENVCIVASDDAVELLGTDLECAVRYKLDEVKVIEPGPVVIPARVALDFVRDLGGDTVSIATADGNCVISSEDDSCELVCIDPDEFPVISRFEHTHTVTVQAGEFGKLVGRTAFAAAREAGRYAMHGVLLEVENDALRLVATDGRRLALSWATIDARAAEKARATPAIVPTRGLQLACRVISDPLDSMEIHVGENQIGLRTKNAEIIARLIDGEFPRYAAVIPKDATNTIDADAALLSRKIRLVANVTGVDARAVKFKAEKGELEIFGQSVGRGEARARVPVEFKGDHAEIAFNPDFVIDGLKNCDSTSVRLQFNERTSPGKFTLGDQYVYVVMPITVDA